MNSTSGNKVVIKINSADLRTAFITQCRADADREDRFVSVTHQQATEPTESGRPVAKRAPRPTGHCSCRRSIGRQPLFIGEPAASSDPRRQAGDVQDLRSSQWIDA